MRKNVKVESSHRKVMRRMYNRVFKSKSVYSIAKTHNRYISRRNNVASCVLNFKSPIKL